MTRGPLARLGRAMLIQVVPVGRGTAGRHARVLGFPGLLSAGYASPAAI